MFPVRSCVKPENLGNRLEYLDGKMLLQWNSHILSQGALVGCSHVGIYSYDLWHSSTPAIIGKYEGSYQASSTGIIRYLH